MLKRTWLGGGRIEARGVGSRKMGLIEVVVKPDIAKCMYMYTCVNLVHVNHTISAASTLHQGGQLTDPSVDGLCALTYGLLCW